MEKIRSGKILILSALLVFSFLASATVIIDEVDYSGHLSDKYMVGRNSDVGQFFYQKFRTGPEVIAVHGINLFLPTNVTESYSIGEKALRIGIAKSSAGVLTYNPLQWYNLGGGWTGGFECHGYFNYKYRGGWRYITFSTGNTYLEPNTEYYIAWFPIGDWWAGSWTAWMPRGTTPGAFDQWAVHRGNVTSTSWNDPYSNYNLSYELRGEKMNITTTPSTVIHNETIKQFSFSINNGDNQGRNWTSGYWLGNATTSTASFERNVTMYENSTILGGSTLITGLTPGKFYHLRGWLTRPGYTLHQGYERHFISYPLPPLNLEINTRDANESIVNWTIQPGFDTVNVTVWKSTTGYVLDPDSPHADARIIYDGSINTTTNQTGAENLYITAWAYCEKTEDGEYLKEWSLTPAQNYSSSTLLDYTVNIYNETQPFGPMVFGGDSYYEYEFATRDHEVRRTSYNSTLSTFTVNCNQSDIFTIRWHRGSNVWIERNYHIPYSDSSADRTINVYLPNVAVGTAKGQTRPVDIRFSGSIDINDYPIGIIRKSRDNTTATVHSDYLQADKVLRTHLITGDQYYFYYKSDSISETRLGGILIYNTSYTVEVFSDPVENRSWTSDVTIQPGWIGDPTQTKTVALWINNTAGGLYRVDVNLTNLTSGNIVKYQGYTGTSCRKITFLYDTTSVEKGRYYANIKMFYYKDRLWWNASVNYFWDPSTSGIEVDMGAFEDLITKALGPSPLYIPATDTEDEIIVPYTTIVITVICFLFFFLFKAHYAAFAVFLIAFVLALMRMFGILPETILSNEAIGVIAIVGILLYLVFSDHLVKKPKLKEPEEK